MSSEHEIRERLDAAWELNDRARSSAIAEAVQWADELGDERLMVETRVHLMRAYNAYYDALALIAPLSWLLEKEKSSPELFEADDIDAMLWCYKYAARTLAYVPATRSAQINQMIDEYETYARRHGASPRAAHARRYNYLRMCGRQAEAELALDAWRASPHDEHSDCPTCDPRYEVMNYLDHGDVEAAWRVALPTMMSDDPCNAQPHGIEAQLLIDLAQAGHWRESWLIYQRGVRIARRDPDGLSLAGIYLRYLTATGRVDEAIRLFRETARFLTNVEDGSSLAQYLTGVVYLTNRLRELGRGDETLWGGTIVGSNAWHPFSDLAAPTATQAHHHLARVLRELVARFDARDDTTWHADQLARDLALPLLDDPLIDPDDLTGVVVKAVQDPLPGVEDPEPHVVAPDAPEGALPVPAPSVNPAYETYEVSVPIPDDLPGLLDLAGRPETSWHTTVRGRIFDHFAEHHWHTTDDEVAALSEPQQVTYWLTRSRAAMLLGLGDVQFTSLDSGFNLAQKLGLAPERLNFEVEAMSYALGRMDRRSLKYYESLEFPRLLADAKAMVGEGSRAPSLFSAVLGIGQAAARCRVAADVRDSMALVMTLTDRLLDEGLDPAAAAYVSGVPQLFAATVTMLGRDYAEACQLAEELLQLTTTSSIAAQGQGIIGHASVQADEDEAAIGPLREAVNWYLATGQRVFGLSEVQGLAAALHASNRPIELASFVEQMLIRYEDLPSGDHLYTLRYLLAEGLLGLADYPGAIAHGEAAGDWFIVDEADSSPQRAVMAYSSAASAAELGGLMANAGRLHGRVAAVAAKLNDVPMQSRALRRSAIALGLVPSTSREALIDKVTPLLNESRSLLEGLDIAPSKKAWELADCDEDRALVLWRLDENLEAIDWVNAAIAGFEASRDQAGQARACLLGARAAIDGNLTELAVDYAKRARELFDRPALRNHALRLTLEEVEARLGLGGDE